MKLTTTTTHEIVFSVEYFEPTEGGMDSESFGGPVLTIEEAAQRLELAKILQPKNDWLIVGRAKITTTKA